MLAKFSVKRPYTVVVGVVLAIVLGIISFTNMTVDLLPGMNMPYAIIMTTYVGASPEEVEMTVTKPVEEAMATISNIKNISSTSQDNASVVMLEFEESANMDSATIEMRESIDMITGYWPETVSNPIIMKINPDMLPVMVAAISATDVDVEKEILPELESLEGVGSVTATGTVEETIEVSVDAKKIKDYNQKLKKHLKKEFQEAEEALAKAQKEIEEGKKALKKAEKEAATKLGDASAEVGVQEAKLNLGLLEIQESLRQLEAKEAQLNEQMNAQLPALEAQEAELLKQKEALKAQLGEGPAYDAAVAQIDAALGQITNGKQQFTNAKTQIATAKTTLTTTKKQLEEGAITLAEAKGKMTEGQLQAIMELNAGNLQLSLGEQTLTDQMQQFEDARNQAYEKADLNNILTVDMVKTILTAQNFNMPAGYVTEEAVDYLIRVGDEFASVEDLEQLVLIDMEGIDPIQLSDIATVELVDDSDEVYAKLNGQNSLVLNIQKQTGYATAEVSERLLDKFEELEDSYDNLQIVTLMDQGVYIDLIVNSVLQNLLMGAVLAIVILLIFLRDFRPTLIIACSIPISLLTAIALMCFSGVTLNMISLSGLALAVGMLVDNSIVVIENIYRMRNEEGKSVKEAAKAGAQQVSGAIIASTLTTVCVFAPIVFTEGITKQLFVDMGLTIAYALLASLIVAMTLVPMMAAGMLKKMDHKPIRWLEKVQNGYARLLRVSLKHKWVALVLALVLLGGSAALSFSKGTAFMPEMESPQISVTVTTEKGTTFRDATKIADEVGEVLMELPDVTDVGATAGGNAIMSLSGGSGNSVSLYALVKENPSMTNAQMQAFIEEKTKDMEAEIAVSTSSMDMSMLGGSGITIQIEGRDLDVLQKTAQEIGTIVEGVKGIAQVTNGVEETTGELRIVVDKDKAAKYNLTVAQVYQEIAARLQTGSQATTITTDTDEWDVYVKDAKQDDLTREDIRNMKMVVKQADGTEKKVKLSKFVTFEEAEGLQAIKRDSHNRYIQVVAEIEKSDNIGLVSNRVSDALEDYKMPAGYTMEMVGEDETINEALFELVKMLGLAVLFMYLIMVAQFQSLRSPFIVMFTIPLAFTGGFIGLAVADIPVSVIAMIGFIMLSGVIVNNGIVFVDYANQLIDSGMDMKDALVETGRARLRPIVMTALTTILGLSTLAMGMGQGADMVQPMAIVTVGGLIYGTLLTLFVVPSIYALFNRRKGKK